MTLRYCRDQFCPGRPCRQVGEGPNAQNHLPGALSSTAVSDTGNLVRLLSTNLARYIEAARLGEGAAHYSSDSS